MFIVQSIGRRPPSLVVDRQRLAAVVARRNHGGAEAFDVKGSAICAPQAFLINGQHEQGQSEDGLLEVDDPDDSGRVRWYLCQQ